MTEFELGWIVAAVEGEGSFYVTANNFIGRKGVRHTNYLPQISITNSDLLFLERCQHAIAEITGKTRPITPDHPGNAPNHKRIQKVFISNYSAIVKFCDVVIPHLCGKKKQAMLVRQLAALCFGNRGRGISPELRRRFYDQVRELNTGHLRKSLTANTPDMDATATMKIESELNGNVERGILREPPPSAYLH